jgi:hypothetical protein
MMLPLPRSNGARYQVGCAGMFMLAGESIHLPTYADEDEAIVACESGPAGCEVYDTVTKEWIGPTSQEEINEAKARIAKRGESTEGQER